MEVFYNIRSSPERPDIVYITINAGETQYSNYLQRRIGGIRIVPENKHGKSSKFGWVKPVIDEIAWLQTYSENPLKAFRTIYKECNVYDENGRS